MVGERATICCSSLKKEPDTTNRTNKININSSSNINTDIGHFGFSSSATAATFNSTTTPTLITSATPTTTTFEEQQTPLANEQARVTFVQSHLNKPMETSNIKKSSSNEDLRFSNAAY